MPFTPSERSTRARRAAHAKWALTADRAAGTEAKRRAFLARFDREVDKVDPEGKLPPDVRARMALSALRSYMSGLALKRMRGRSAEKTKAVKSSGSTPEEMVQDGD